MSCLKVYKYKLDAVGTQPVELPVGSKILSVQAQFEQLCLWVLVDPAVNKQTEKRVIEIVGTGIPLRELDGLPITREFLATVQMRGGSLVWHVFELVSK